MLYNNKDKILLCACKKYTKGQKNGILLIYNLESENNNNEINEQFYDTKFFEVHCFCQILEESNNDKVLSTNEELKFTNNFLVGGLDTVKKRGIIKLYEIKQKKKDNKEIFEIEIIQNIEFKKKGSFKGFQRAISCIEQSKSRNVYITSWDGYVYEFDAILRKVSPATSSAPLLKDGNQSNPVTDDLSADYIVYPLRLYDVPTAITTVEATGKIVDVKYYNMMGIESDVPFEGVNIEVITFTDGSRSSRKIMK
jgi:hypothetical protein